MTEDQKDDRTSGLVTDRNGENLPDTHQQASKDHCREDPEACPHEASYRQIFDQTERELLESQRRFQELVESIEEWIWEVDTEVVYTYVSPRVKDMLGYEPKEMIGHSAFDYMPPREAEGAARVFRKIATAQRSFNDLEKICLRKDGSPVVIASSGKPFFAPDGTLAGYRGLDRNITDRKMAEEELWRSEQRFRDTFEQAAVGMVHVDTRGQFIRVNLRFCDLLGYSLEELLGLSVPDVSHPCHLEDDRRAVKRMQEGEIDKYCAEKRYVRKDGSFIWMNVTVSPIRGEEGVPKYYVAVVEDISSRKRAEEALQLSTFTIDNASEAIYWIRSDASFYQVNEQACRSLGYSRDELLTMTVHDIDPDFPAEVWPSHWKDLKDRGSMVLESVHRTKDGQEIPVEVVANYLKFGDKEYNCAFARDITERKRAEKERELLRTAIEQAAESVVITNADGAILYVNPAFERASGYSREEASGQDLRLLESGKHDEAFYERMLNKLTRGEVWTGRITNRSKDGTLYAEEATISPVWDSSGELTHFVSVNHDVTAVAKLESQLRQAQKMEAIGTLTGGIAHDFNNIIYAVLGYTQLAMDDLEEESPAYRNLTEVVRAGRRASDLVGQMLTFSRSTEQEHRPLQLQPVIKEALKLLRGSLPATITINERIDPACGSVLGDPTQIHQIILNLSTNAAHAMREEGGTLDVSLSQVDVPPDEGEAPAELSPGQHVLITVSDTGHGMSASTLERIFEPYFSTKSAEEGTGLGLATVHGIVKSSDGAIEVQSEPDKGATFRVYLPLCQKRDWSDDRWVMEAKLPRCHGRILVVDDDKTIVDMATLTLERIGCRVVAHTSSVAALEAFRAAPADFDVVITDQIMPEMTGSDLAQEMLNIRPDQPIILITGYSNSVDEDQAKAIGVKLFLHKPISLQELVRSVRQAMGEENEDKD